MIEDIIRMTRDLRKQMESNIPILEREIDLMIQNREERPENIEWVLDTLLDYIDLGVGEKQFLRLNSYYASFYPENSAQYDKFYLDTVGQ